jgi:ABC-2 type transport system permease protein
LTSILSGALFPVSVLPAPVETLARAFPAYYGINGLRDALLGSGAWSDVWPDLVVLAAFAAVLLPISVQLFGRALTAAKRAGTLANY